MMFCKDLLNILVITGTLFGASVQSNFVSKSLRRDAEKSLADNLLAESARQENNGGSERVVPNEEFVGRMRQREKLKKLAKQLLAMDDREFYGFLEMIISLRRSATNGEDIEDRRKKHLAKKGHKVSGADASMMVPISELSENQLNEIVAQSHPEEEDGVEEFKERNKRKGFKPLMIPHDLKRVSFKELVETYLSVHGMRAVGGDQMEDMMDQTSARSSPAASKINSEKAQAKGFVRYKDKNLKKGVEESDMELSPVKVGLDLESNQLSNETIATD